MDKKRLTTTSLVALVLSLAFLTSWASAQGPNTGNSPVRVVKTPHRHGPSCRRFIPPAKKVVQQKVWVKGEKERVWHPPVYRTERDGRGNPIQVMERRGFYETLEKPGRFEVKPVEVTTEGRWVLVCGR